MEIKIAEKQTGHLMTDLGIKSERCEELCGVISEAIETLHEEGKDKVTLAQVLQKAVKHARTDNELVFVATTAGEYFAAYQAHVESMTRPSMDEISSLLRSLHGARFAAQN